MCDKCVIKINLFKYKRFKDGKLLTRATLSKTKNYHVTFYDASKLFCWVLRS